jgi:hypothetical protein
MGWLRRAAGVIFAIGVAIGAGLVFLLVAALVDPVTRSSGFTLVQFATAAVVDADGTESLGYSGLTELSGFIWMAVMTVCVAPLVSVALLGEVAKVRAFSWYSGATGAAAASAPWLIRATLRLPRAAEFSSVELRFALIFFLTGLISGAIYWFLAGRSTDEWRAI